jgi:release factor glutamine methyltransferase
MHTVAAARAWAVEELKRARTGNPLLTADLLLAHVLGWERPCVLSRTDHIVPEEAWTRLRDLITRRVQGEPLQYLTGEKEFYGLVFQVAPGVLIPRPETEILVEKALALIENHSRPGVRFADIGAGSGCIAISIAHEFPSALGWAVDISEAALRIARENAIRHKVSDRILLARSNLLDCFPPNEIFDFVLCNPPYVALRDSDSLPSEVRDYEPHEALFGGESGLDFYRKLFPEVFPRLVAGGYLLLEAGAGQAEWVGRQTEKEGFSLEATVDDLQGIPRCIIARKILPRK